MFNIQHSWNRKKLKGHEYWFWLIDMHGTIFQNNYVEGSYGGELFVDCVQPLQYLSKRKDTKLILWTSSHDTVINNAREFLEMAGIHFDFVNENPIVKNDTLCNFDKKLYFDVLLDDKAGFNPEKDWKKINSTLKVLFLEDYLEKEIGNV